MSYVLKQLSDSKAILLKLDASLDAESGLLMMYQELHGILDEQSEPVALIYDIIGLPIRLDLLMQVTKTMKDNKNLNPASHPMVSKAIVITDSPIIKLSIDGFQKFGGADKPTLVAFSKEEALTMV